MKRTITRALGQTGVLCAAGLTCMVSGCQPDKPELEIRAPGVEIEVDRDHSAQGDLHFSVKESHPGKKDKDR